MQDGGSTLTLDGRHALGQVVCTLAADLAARRALEHGVAAVAVRQSGHAGRLADYADRACGHGVAVLLFANDSGAAQGVAPPGAHGGAAVHEPARSRRPASAAAAPRDRPLDERRGARQGARAGGRGPAGAGGLDARRPAAASRRRQGLRARPARRGARGRRVRGRRRLGRTQARTIRACSCWPSTPRASARRPSLPAALEAMLAYVLAVPARARRGPVRAPGSTLAAAALDPDARIELAPALAVRLAIWPASSPSQRPSGLSQSGCGS